MSATPGSRLQTQVFKQATPVLDHTQVVTYKKSAAFGDLPAIVLHGGLRATMYCFHTDAGLSRRLPVNS
jgi:hypothetical protein